jgi:methionine-rich copper-binding protein CopC
VLVSILGAVVTLAVTAAPAAAHNALVSTAPAAGARLAQPPGAVVLTFDEPALALGTAIVVTDPSGQEIQSGPPDLVDNTVTQPLRAGAPAGPYTVVWRVTSADGHPISGRLAFAADAPAASSGVDPASATTTPPATAAPSGPGAGGSAWVGLLGGLAVLGVVLVLLRRRTERRAD